MAVRADGRWCWVLLGLGAAAAGAAGLAARPHVDAAVRLGPDRQLPATTVLVTLALAGVGVAALGPRHRLPALISLAGLAFGASGSWLALTRNRFSGPVLATLGHRHGVHLTDAVALLPAAVGLAVLARATRALTHPA